MKTKIYAIAIVLMTLGSTLSAQDNMFYEKHSGVLNLGVGLGGYSGPVGRAFSVFDINYELGITQNFTLAPFITFYSYSDGNYTAMVAPVGVKGTYYLDQLLQAGPNWDFYVAGSLGVAIVGTTWNASYTGDRNYYSMTNPLYLDFHLGTEYHISRFLGVFLDLSTKVSTIGIAIH
jgi:hypothetical protein